MDDQHIHELHLRKLKDHGFILCDGYVKPPDGMGDFSAGELSRKLFEEARREISDSRLDIKPVPMPEPASGTIQAGDGPFWHDQNPWNDHIIYVWPQELAECVFHLGKLMTTSDGVVICTPERMLAHWRQYGNKLDAYILTGKVITAGIRYGPYGPDYLSPDFSLPKLTSLLGKYR